MKVLKKSPSQPAENTATAKRPVIKGLLQDLVLRNDRVPIVNYRISIPLKSLKMLDIPILSGIFNYYDYWGA